MDSELLRSLLTVFAPTVADKVFRTLTNKQLKAGDLNILLFALTAEQNAKLLDCMDKMSENFSALGKTVKDIGEAVAVIYKRTEKL